MQSDVLVLQMDSVTQAWTTQSCHCKLNISTFVVNDVASTSLLQHLRNCLLSMCINSISFVE